MSMIGKLLLAAAIFVGVPAAVIYAPFIYAYVKGDGSNGGRGPMGK